MLPLYTQTRLRSTPKPTARTQPAPQKFHYALRIQDTMSGGVRDPYQVLGVERSASAEEIKAAFRRLAREHHPDRNPGDPSAQGRFQEINAAYQILSDPQKRARFEARPSGGAGPFAGGAASSLEDWLSEILGGGFGGQPEASGNIEQVIELSFEEAALGCVRQVTYARADLCELCQGSGGEPKARVTRCAQCSGTGRVRLGALGWIQLGMDKACGACHGTGSIPEKRCSACQGRGLTERARTMSVNIPCGIESGTTQTVIGGGNRITSSAPPGDLELVVKVRAHPEFSREGDHVVSRVVVTFLTAALGGELKVKTLQGESSLKVPAGTAHDDVLTLKGQGVPHRFRSGAGDHRCKIQVKIPTELSPRARQLIEQAEFEISQGASVGVLQRLKGFFSS